MTDSAVRQELESLAREGHQRAWWSRYSDALPESYSLYIGLEAEATSQRIYSNSVVPGVLQTEGYCRATIKQALIPSDKRLPEIIEKRVEVRMRRQDQLRKEWPNLDVVLDESVLLRPLGGAAVLRDQLSHLLSLAGRPGVSVRILPFSRSDRIVLSTPFTILGFNSDPDVAYIETAVGGMYADQGDVQFYGELFQQLKDASLGREASEDILRDARESVGMRTTHR